ncbi:MAG: cytochrome c3 family protein [Desulfamplus sp.]|nr:cytochrome c3 family protein [Desulfamplus sp.]
MSKKSVTLMLSVAIALLFAATCIYAGTEVADTFKMETKEYAKRTKGLADFTHKDHIEKHKIACGDCHHDDKGKPLADLKMGDNVQKCVECHKETGKPPEGEKLGKKEKIVKYHEKAIHANCVECHKESNKKAGDPKGKGPAPTSCNDCHPKK